MCRYQVSVSCQGSPPQRNIHSVHTYETTSMAYAELYLVIARLARQFDIELIDTTEENVRFARDYVVPHAEDGPWSVKARISKVVDY